jgi:hypothetical protein
LRLHDEFDVDALGLATDDEPVERPRERCADGVRPAASLTSPAIKARILRQSLECVGFGVAQLPPCLDLALLRVQAGRLGAGGVSFGAQFAAELLPVLGSDPTVGVVAAYAGESLVGQPARASARVVLVASGAGPTNASSRKTRSYARLPAIGSPSASRIHCDTNAPRFFGPPTMGSDSVVLSSS